MAAIRLQHDPDTTAHLELLALERMIRALCVHVERLACAARERGELDTREAGFQLQAFAERHEQALRLLGAADDGEAHEIRVARLEKAVQALDCSRVFFCGKPNSG